MWVKPKRNSKKALPVCETFSGGPVIRPCAPKVGNIVNKLLIKIRQLSTKNTYRTFCHTFKN